MYNILLVEDDKDLSDITLTYLTRASFNVDPAYCFADAERLISEKDYDIILLDIMLPDRNGNELCREIRDKCSCPIIFMSCLEDSDTIVDALKSGGDDYMVKPVRFPELIARIDAISRRIPKKKSEPIRKFASFTVDTLHRNIMRGDEQIDLSTIEFSILLYMIDNPDTLLLYQDIYQNVWNSDSLGDFRTVMVHVSNLRKKLDPDHIGIISTIRGAGYIFSDV